MAGGGMAKAALAAMSGEGDDEGSEKSDRFDAVADELAEAIAGGDKRKIARVLRNTLAMLSGM